MDFMYHVRINDVAVLRSLELPRQGPRVRGGLRTLRSGRPHLAVAARLQESRRHARHTQQSRNRKLYPPMRRPRHTSSEFSV